MPYAERTHVPVERSRQEIERVVTKRGAKGFMSGYHGKVARIEFLIADRHIRISVTVPDRAPAARQKWRALLLVVKAKFESIDAGIATTEEAFFSDIVLPETGKTVWETAREPLKLAYEGKTVQLLGYGP